MLVIIYLTSVFGGLISTLKKGKKLKGFREMIKILMIIMMILVLACYPLHHGERKDLPCIGLNARNYFVNIINFKSILDYCTIYFREGFIYVFLLLNSGIMLKCRFSSQEYVIF